MLTMHLAMLTMDLAMLAMDSTMLTMDFDHVAFVLTMLFSDLYCPWFICAMSFALYCVSS